MKQRFTNCQKMKFYQMICALLSAMLVLVVQVDSLSCECDRMDCKTPTCIGGVVQDACQCCFVCAKMANESCGGIYDIYGQCDMGLSCVIQPKHGELVTGNEPGICKATDSLTITDMCHDTAYDGCNIVGSSCICGREIACSNPYQYQTSPHCEFSLAVIQSSMEDCAKSRCERPPSPVCPDDSILIEGQFVLGECCPHPSRCECSSDRCAYNLCHPDYKRVLVTKGNDKPGSCCDVYECQLKDEGEDECAMVKCSIRSLQSVTCPSDSIAVRNPASRSKCCPGEPICQCSSLKCTKPTCTGDMKLTVNYRSDGKPGSCCDEYVCTNETIMAGCAVNGTHHPHGTTYDRDNCRTCECMNGISLCGKRQCPELKCKLKSIKRGACCPVCHVEEGTNYPDNKPYPLCSSADGTKAYRVGESWSPQNCTYCTCEEGGITRCKAAFCQEPTVIVISCPSMLECEISESSCPYGFDIDHNGCQLCQCRTDPHFIVDLCPPMYDECKLNCPRGFEQNELGCDVCACKKKACSSLQSCKKDCPFGYKKNKKGCDRCKCKRCPLTDETTCGKQCKLGLDVNKYGCTICKCKDNSSSNTTSKPQTGSCVDSQTNLRHDDGEEWTSGCFFCACRGGDVMCDVIKCPVPDCDNPVKNPNDCCSICPDSVTTDTTPLVPQSLSCQEPGGDWFVEGESWTVSQCTSCTCSSGHVLCTSIQCPAVPCHNPVFVEGECCPKCTEFLFNVSVASQNLSSTCLDGKYQSGDVWRDDDCTSCVCFAGNIKCYSERCPQIHDCTNPVLTRGQCCPRCLGEKYTAPKVCNNNDKIYKEGDAWNITCATCLCHDGEATCLQDSCPKLPDECKRYRPEGECCDKCKLEETDDVFSHTNSEQTPQQPKQPKPTAHSSDVLPLAVGVSVSVVIAVAIIFGALYAKRRCGHGHSTAKYTPTPRDPRDLRDPRGLMMTRTISTTTQCSQVSTLSEDYPLTGQC